ncbi:hypothetical protein CORC01_07275 [Colletotrichum orchidophilum]|uniref:Uncharacterized protein n=1 Tax=Colletotrichum orchidophilum TaxID=1209926 RepID=A0A1G4B861_9PEZI|nr:uncharacterized protein CORC01_07275 [Colletotrichum orchidophilum]OHE97493.1 hypothetical protein CORC01_07275 [Colletotrichum orchidophilum]
MDVTTNERERQRTPAAKSQTDMQSQSQSQPQFQHGNIGSSAICKPPGTSGKPELVIPSPLAVTSQLSPRRHNSNSRHHIMSSCASLLLFVATARCGAAIQSLPFSSPLVHIPVWVSDTDQESTTKTTWVFLNVTLPCSPVRLSASRRTCVCNTHASQGPRPQCTSRPSSAAANNSVFEPSKYPEQRPLLPGLRTSQQKGGSAPSEPTQSGPLHSHHTVYSGSPSSPRDGGRLIERGRAATLCIYEIAILLTLAGRPSKPNAKISPTQPKWPVRTENNLLSPLALVSILRTPRVERLIMAEARRSRSG